MKTSDMRYFADALSQEGRNDMEVVHAAAQRLLHRAADEIDAARVTRLAQYRCAALQGLLASKRGPWNPKDIVETAEDVAHAMLAAERSRSSGGG